jgi:hypothetical protein
MDRVAKPAVYAEQGIPYFWRIDAVDEGAVRLQSFALGKDVYALTAELGPGETATLEHPWPVTVDMADVVRPGR